MKNRKEYHREYSRKNSQVLKERTRLLRRRQKKICFDYYSKGNIRCSCCGENNELFLCLDHINNDGYKHRKENKILGSNVYSWAIKNKFPPIFQVLCYNCNIGKHLAGSCPHTHSLTV